MLNSQGGLGTVEWTWGPSSEHLMSPCYNGRRLVFDMTRTEAWSFRELKALLSEEYDNYRRDWTRPGFRALAMYRFGVWAQHGPRDTLARKILGRAFDLIYIVAHRYVRNNHGIELHRSARLGEGVMFPHQGGIVIHHYAEIGDGCVIQHSVTMGSAGRGVTREEAPKIGANVQIGPGVVILGKVTIGDGARISPNVVIYTDVPPGATVVTNSPRVIYAPNTKRRADMKSNASRTDG